MGFNSGFKGLISTSVGLRHAYIQKEGVPGTNRAREWVGSRDGLD